MEDNNLTVLILATTFPRWEGDTIPQFIYELSKELQRNGLEVIVLAPHHPNAKRQETMSGIRIYRYPYFLPYRYQKLVFQGGILPTVKNSPLALSQVPLLFISLLLHASWIIKEEDINVINAHWMVPNGLVAGLLKSVFGVPHVLTLHAGAVLGLQDTSIGSHISSFVYRRADEVVPVSTHITENFIRLLPNNFDSSNGKFTIQPMGAHISDFDLDRKIARQNNEIDDDDIVGLYVGRLAEKKGIKYLIKAVKELHSDVENFQLTIVGTGSMEDDLQELTKQWDLQDTVKFTGWISEEELRNHYVAADFVIVPSIETASGDTEGMPTVISEAFASGNPVIASEVGGIPDVVDDQVNGFLVQQKQPDELSKKMKILIEEPETRADLSAGALKTAEKLDWKHCGETYAHLLRSAHASSLATKET